MQGSAGGELVLERHPGVEGHVVHHSGARRYEQEVGIALGGQEGVRVEHLIDARTGELGIDGQQIVQVRRSAAPVPQDEQWWLDLSIRDLAAVDPVLIPTDDRVEGAHAGHECRSRPVRRSDSEAVLPQQSHVFPESHAIQAGEEPIREKGPESLGQARGAASGSYALISSPHARWATATPAIASYAQEVRRAPHWPPPPHTRGRESHPGATNRATLVD